MSLLVEWHTCVLLPIDLFFQEKHYKAIILIENIISAVPSTGVCPLRSAYTSRHCFCVQHFQVWYLPGSDQSGNFLDRTHLHDACPDEFFLLTTAKLSWGTNTRCAARLSVAKLWRKIFPWLLLALDVTLRNGVCEVYHNKQVTQQVPKTFFLLLIFLILPPAACPDQPILTA